MSVDLKVEGWDGASGVEENFEFKAYKELSGAIVMRAFQDLTCAYRARRKGKKYLGRKAQWVVDECEGFFRGEWYRELVNGKIDGEKVIEQALVRSMFTKKQETKMYGSVGYKHSI